VAFGKKHGIVICNDNPYSFILNNNRLSILQVEGAKEICIELNSMSKSHNMPGWRMGMLASNAQFVEWILKVKSNIDSGQFKPMQMAAIAALNNSEEWHNEMNINLYKNRRHLAEEIMKSLGCSFDTTQVGMFLWGKIPAHYNDSAELADKVLYSALRCQGIYNTGLYFRRQRSTICTPFALCQRKNTGRSAGKN